MKASDNTRLVSEQVTTGDRSVEQGAKFTPGPWEYVTKEMIAALYDVRADGRVISNISNRRYKPGRELKAILNGRGYPSVRLHFDGRQKMLQVHRLVAMFHLPARPSPKHEIRHLDGNCLNNCAGNLAWGTSKENAADRERHGRTVRGAKMSAAVKAGNIRKRAQP